MHELFQARMMETKCISCSEALLRDSRREGRSVSSRKGVFWEIMFPFHLGVQFSTIQHMKVFKLVTF